MTEHRRDEHDHPPDRPPEKRNDERDQRDDPARAPQSGRDAQLTNRERGERWPIG